MLCSADAGDSVVILSVCVVLADAGDSVVILSVVCVLQMLVSLW